METVGAATWSHSVNSLKPGGTIVISGATSGDAPSKAELTKIFFKQLRVFGSTMGTRTELERLTQSVVDDRSELRGGERPADGFQRRRGRWRQRRSEDCVSSGSTSEYP